VKNILVFLFMILFFASYKEDTSTAVMGKESFSSSSITVIGKNLLSHAFSVFITVNIPSPSTAVPIVATLPPSTAVPTVVTLLPSTAVPTVNALSPDDIDMKITAENFSGKANSKTFHLWGNVKIAKEEALLNADDIIYNSKSSVAVASGNVYFTKSGNELWSHSITLEYKNKRGTCSGNVKMLQTRAPKKGGERIEEAFKDGPVTILADRLDFSWQKPSRVTGEGNVEFHQKDKHIYADSADYVSSPPTVILTNNVKFKKDDGSSLLCHKFTLDIDDNTFDADGSGSSQVLLDFYMKNKKK
jgi:lipopolysaccharide export system protein LptA